MKNSELRRLVSEYRQLKSKRHKSNKTTEKITDLRHRYYHETGQDIETA